MFWMGFGSDVTRDRSVAMKRGGGINAFVLPVVESEGVATMSARESTYREKDGE